MDAALLAGLGADRIIVATGSDPIVPALPGADGPSVVTAEDVLLGRVDTGADVAVVGAGSVGVETAELLCAQGRSVTVIELADDMLSDLSATLRAPLEARIRQTSTRFEFGRRVVGFGEHEVQTESGSLGPFDTIVLAVGYRPDTELSRALRSAGVAHTVIGDAIAPRKISDAVLEGFTAGYAV